MDRKLIALLTASCLGLALVACDTGESWSGGGFAGGGNGGYGGDCSGYSSCEDCTPVVGCGWCTAPSGRGVCAASPDDCPSEEFSWTWNQKGCRVDADASVASSDGGDTDAEGDVSDSGSQLETGPDGSNSDGSSGRSCSAGDASLDAPACG
jgi:hypothetical protein